MKVFFLGIFKQMNKSVPTARLWATLFVLLFFCVPTLLPAQTNENTETSVGIGAFEQAQNPDVSDDDLEILLVPLTATDLAAVSESWQGHVRGSLETMTRTNLALQKTAGSQEAALREKLSKERGEVTQLLLKYRSVLDAWELKGASEDELKPHLDYALALRTGTLQTTDIKTLVRGAFEWLTSGDGGLGLLMIALAILASVWAMMFVAKFLRNLTQRTLEQVPNVSRLLKSFIVTTVYWGVFGLGILVVLGLFGVNVTPLFAVFGGLSFILGFALQETLGNLASGLMIMVLKPFDTGDYIEVGGASGFVDEMSVVSTKIRTFDNQIIVVPNSKIWGDIITNVSASEERRVDLVFGIGYSDDAAQAIEVLSGIVSAHPMCLTDPEPEIFVGELGDSSVNIFCRPWTKSENYWVVYWDLTGQAKEQFDKEGISIPFPQRDVHLISQEA